jgi:hypothetical protein
MCVCSAINLEGVLVLKQGWVREQGTPYSLMSRSRSMNVRAEKVKGCDYTWSAVHKCHSPMSVLVQQLNPSGHLFWVPTQVGFSVSPSKTVQEAQSTVYNLHNRRHSRGFAPTTFSEISKKAWQICYLFQTDILQLHITRRSIISEQW